MHKTNETFVLPDWDPSNLPFQLIPYMGYQIRNGKKFRLAVHDVDVYSAPTWWVQMKQEAEGIALRGDKFPERSTEDLERIGRQAATTIEAAHTVGRYLAACLADPRVQAAPEVFSLMKHVQKTLSELPFTADKLPLASKFRLELEQKIARTLGASAAAKAKRARDPKVAAKAEVEDCWKRWQAKPSRYPSKAAFSRDMLSKFECLSSARVIEDWCREWKNAAEK